MNKYFVFVFLVIEIFLLISIGIYPGETSVFGESIENSSAIRYLELGESNPLMMSALYGVPKVTASKEPFIFSYSLDKPAYVFWGSRPADHDLKKAEGLVDQIIRYPTENQEKACPVILANGQGMVIHFYHPGLSLEERERFIGYWISSIKNALDDLDIQEIHHLFFVRSGWRLKQVGRIDGENDNIILYLNLSLEDDQTNIMFRNLRLGQYFWQKLIVPLGSLEEFGLRINRLELAEKISKDFSQKTGFFLEESSLSEEELLKINSLEDIVGEEEWRLNAFRKNNFSSSEKSFRIGFSEIMKSFIYCLWQSPISDIRRCFESTMILSAHALRLY